MSKGKGSQLNKIYLSFVICIAVFALALVDAFAGDINSNEQSVIKAATATFEYENEEYKAKDSYVKQLTDYLKADDIDLTAEEAEKAIKKINANIEQSVKDGYLYKVEKDSGDNSTETSKKDDEEEEEDDDDTEPEDEEDVGIWEAPDEEEASTAAAKKKEKKKDTYILPFDTTEEETTQTEIIQPAEDKAIGSLKFDPEDRAITYVAPSTGKSFKLPSIEYPGETEEYSKMILMTVMIMSAIILLSLAVLIVTKCFPFQKKKRKRQKNKYYFDHKMRKRIRKVIGWIFTVILTVHLFSLLLIIGIRTSVFRNGFVIDHLTSSGYYRYIYNQMTNDMKAYLEGLPEDDIDKIVDQVGYDRFLNTAKSQVNQSLRGEKATYDLTDFKNRMTETVKDIKMSDESRERVVNVITSYMEQYSLDVVGSSIYGIRLSIKDILRASLWIMIVNVMVAITILIMMDRYRHRGVRYVSRAVLSASIILVAMGLWLIIMKPYSKLYMDPEYLFLFIVDYLKRGLVVTMSVGMIGFLSGIGLHFLVDFVRNIQIDQE